MEKYKGIDLRRNNDMFNYITTFHNIPHALREVEMECDRPLQKLVNRHYLKRKVLVILFNISFYIVPIILIKG